MEKELVEWCMCDSCPDTGAELVCTDRASGKQYSHTEGGGNPQCLPVDYMAQM